MMINRISNSNGEREKTPTTTNHARRKTMNGDDGEPNADQSLVDVVILTVVFFLFVGKLNKF